MGRDIENRNKWQREYYKKKKNDPEYIKQKKRAAKKYYLNNKEKCRKKRKEYFEKNKKKYNEYRRKYRYNNPVGIYSVIKDGLNKKGYPRNNLLNISKEEFVKWYNQEEKICYYCKRTLKEIKEENDRMNEKINRLTIDRANNKRGYEKGNMVLACMRCNAIKSDYFTRDEMLLIGKIIHDKNIKKY